MAQTRSFATIGSTLNAPFPSSLRPNLAVWISFSSPIPKPISLGVQLSDLYCEGRLINLEIRYVFVEFIRHDWLYSIEAYVYEFFQGQHPQTNPFLLKKSLNA